MIRLFSIVSIYLGVVFSLLGQSPVELFNQANSQYAEANYTEAIKQYLAVIEAGKVSPELYHNLGNAYFQTNQTGRAMLAYERGLRLDPNNSSIQSDQEVVKEVIESDIFEVPPFAPIRYWRAFTNLLSPNMWVILQMLGLGFILFYLSRLWLKPYLPMEKWMSIGKTIAICVVVTSTLALISLWVQKHNSVEAIVLSDTQLYVGPDERSGEVNPIPEGEKVTILDDFDGWWKVQLLNLEEGYLQQSAAEKI